MYPNPIKHFEIHRGGQPVIPYRKYDTEDFAKEIAHIKNHFRRDGDYKVYAMHQDGTITGPY